MAKVKSYSVPSTQEANVIVRCNGDVHFYIPVGKDGTNGVTPVFTIGTTTTLPAGSNATVTQTGTIENPVLNFGIPGSGTSAIYPKNDFSGWMMTYTTTANPSNIIFKTTFTYTITSGIAYSTTTGVVTITPNWWWIDYSFIATSPTAQTLTCYVMQGTTALENSIGTQPLLANTPVCISHRFIVSANVDLPLKLFVGGNAIKLDTINWNVQMQGEQQ